MIELFQADAIEIMKGVEDKSIDLIISDWPYNIKKADWDKWKNVKSYIEFIDKVLFEYQRILKDNGSFYFFHNDFFQVVEIQKLITDKYDFIFQQFITWNKRFDSAKNKGFLDGFIEVEHLRNYQQMSEYILFYTFQDDTGLKLINSDYNHYVPIKEYLKSQQNNFEHETGILLKNIVRWTKHFHSFAQGQSFGFPTKESYLELQEKTGFFKKPYEELRKEYEELRYIFNNQKTHHSIWNYEIAKKQGHITPKPVGLIENIIKHSTNENDLVADFFFGSGTTPKACKNLNRDFIGSERNPLFYKIAKSRIN